MQSIRGRRWLGRRHGLLAVVSLAASLTGACSGEPPASEAPPVEPAADVEAPPGDTANQAPAMTSMPVAVAVVPTEGPFPHGEHRSVACTTCHETVAGHASHAGVECSLCHAVPESFASMPVRSPSECMACHHGQAAASRGCAACHGSGPSGLLAVEVPFTVASRPTVDRDLTFSHEVHGSQACGTCHREGVTLPFGLECSSCHIVHHSRRASCLECHQDARASHQVDAHLGCGGTGCHTDSRILSLPEVRNMCLVCHADRVDHQAGQECVQCHVTGRSPQENP